MFFIDKIVAAKSTTSTYHTAIFIYQASKYASGKLMAELKMDFSTFAFLFSKNIHGQIHGFKK